MENKERKDNPDDIFNPEEDSKTAFNSSLDIIQRISRLEYSLVSAFLHDDLTNAYKLLVLIHSEIDFKLKDEYRTELEEYEADLYEELKLAEETFISNGSKYFKNGNVREEVRLSLLELKKKLSVD